MNFYILFEKHRYLWTIRNCIGFVFWCILDVNYIKHELFRVIIISRWKYGVCKTFVDLIFWCIWDVKVIE